MATGRAVDNVWGVVFVIDAPDKRRLDDSERGYAPLEVPVVAVDDLVSVLTYLAGAAEVDESLKPYTWYKEFVIRGARAHELPEDYVRRLEAIDATEDSDEARERRNLAVLAGGSE